MKRNVFVFVLLIALAVTVYGQNASDFDYTENDGKITITFYKNRALKDVRIPETINGKPVVAIGKRAFTISLDPNVFTDPRDRSGLTSVVIPGSVKTIGEEAFYMGNNLTSVTIGNGVITIGEKAFLAQELTSITIPDSVIEIKDEAFGSNRKLNSITLGNSVAIIGSEAFSYCTSLTSVTLPASVTSIRGSAFERCTSLIEINVATNNREYTAVDGVLYNKNRTTLVIYPSGKTQCQQVKPSTI